MKNKLSQEYKDDLYEKVLEKKRQRTVRRKKMLSIFIVFVSVVGFTTLGFSLKGQDDYHNFFTSETENIMIEDEYQYFDDLGIKLEFINIDDNSLTLGINIKYEDIAEYEMYLSDKVYDKENKCVLIECDLEKSMKNNIKNIKTDIKYISKSEVRYIFCYEFYECLELLDLEYELNNVKLIEKNNIDNKKDFVINYKKEISIEE